MLSRVALTAAVLAVTVTAGSGALAANHNVMALSNDTFSNAGSDGHPGRHRHLDQRRREPQRPFRWHARGELRGRPRVDRDADLQHRRQLPLRLRPARPRHGREPITVSPSARRPVGPTPPGQQPPGGGGPPAGPGPGGPGPSLPLLRITLKVSDATPPAGAKVRLSGVVRPARDGRRVQIQKRLRSGKYVTVATRAAARCAARPSRTSACACASPPTRCCAPAWPATTSAPTGLSAHQEARRAPPPAGVSSRPCSARRSCSGAASSFREPSRSSRSGPTCRSSRSPARCSR